MENPDIGEGLKILARMIARHLLVNGNNRGQEEISDISQDPEGKDYVDG